MADRLLCRPRHLVIEVLAVSVTPRLILTSYPCSLPSHRVRLLVLCTSRSLVVSNDQVMPWPTASSHKNHGTSHVTFTKGNPPT